ncbi:MAG TPA: ATP-binding protein, partial [Phenylobacterium sp.]|nr:ATP-binding protein [Phenylobacterium sp.]
RGANEFGAIDVGDNAYQMTLAGMVVPAWINLVFAAVAAAAMTFIGHPVLAGLAFAGTALFDLFHQAVIRRAVASSPQTEMETGLRRIAVLSALRSVIYLAPATYIAVRGGAAELMLFGLGGGAFIAIACANGSLSRVVFASITAPLAPAVLTVAFARLPIPQAIGVSLALLSTATLLALISLGTGKAIGAWHEAFNANQALIPQLEDARDRAIAEGRAADEAREEARRANRAKSNFLATMSHEIRTPMNGVLGMAQLLKREETDPRQIGRLETLIESGEYLLAILNDILDVSKIDAGRLELSPHAENLPAFVEQLVGFWGARADEKGVALRLEVGGDLPAFVNMDALRLRQVLFNLLGNALKFTDAGSVTLSVQAEPDGNQRSLVRFAVADTGPGIPAAHLPLLFERFSQVDDSEQRRFGGTGLGLAIARQLTDLMGGRIWVESELGQGATFHVEVALEVAEAPHAGSQPATEREPEAETAHDGLEVLIVDDNPVNLQVLEQILAAFGHAVQKAADGPSALEALGLRAFDLVIMDIQMPGMTGVEALQALRASDGPNRTAPVIALTADVTSGGRSHYLDLGFDEHTPKPVLIPDLMASISRAMAGSEASRGDVAAA